MTGGDGGREGRGVEVMGLRSPEPGRGCAQGGMERGVQGEEAWVGVLRGLGDRNNKYNREQLCSSARETAAVQAGPAILVLLYLCTATSGGTVTPAIRWTQ